MPLLPTWKNYYTKNMSREEKLLLIILGIFYFSVSLAGVFFSIYLFRIGGFTAVATYYLIALLTITLTSVFSGFLLHIISAKNLLRIGLLFFSILFLLLFILKENTSHYLVVLGILGGLANGTFWAGNNIMQYTFTKRHTRNSFLGYFGFFSDAAATIAPVLSGILIFIGSKIVNYQFGYSLVFSLVGILMLCIAIVSGYLPSLSHVEFKLTHLFSSFPGTWRLVFVQQFFMGLWDTSLWTVTGVLLYAILKTEIQVGIAAGIGTTITALGALGAGKILNKYPRAFLWGMILAPLGIISFVFSQTILGIICIFLLTYTTYQLLNIPISKNIYDTIDETGLSWKKSYHFLVEKDVMISLGRAVSYVILLFVLFQHNSLKPVLNWMLFTAGIPFFLGLLLFFQTKSSEERASKKM